jgi:hypothetical protein
MKTAAWPLLAVVLAAAPGCAYFKNRARDFGDIIGFGFSPTGGGIGIRAGATRLVALEVMAQKDERFLGRYGRSVRWQESAYGLFSFVWNPSLENEKPPKRFWYDAFTTSRRRTYYPDRGIEDRRYTLFIHSGAENERVLDALDVELGASALFGGIEVAVRPGEFLDFLLGWFGLDLAGDDGVAETAKPIAPVPSRPSQEDPSKEPKPAQP